VQQQQQQARQYQQPQQQQQQQQVCEMFSLPTIDVSTYNFVAFLYFLLIEHDIVHVCVAVLHLHHEMKVIICATL